MSGNIVDGNELETCLWSLGDVAEQFKEVERISKDEGFSEVKWSDSKGFIAQSRPPNVVWSLHYLPGLKRLARYDRGLMTSYLECIAKHEMMHQVLPDAGEAATNLAAASKYEDPIDYVRTTLRGEMIIGLNFFVRGVDEDEDTFFDLQVKDCLSKYMQRDYPWLKRDIADRLSGEIISEIYNITANPARYNL